MSCRSVPVVAISITPSSNPTFATIDIGNARSAGLTENLTINGQPETEYAFFTLNFPVSYASPGESPPSIRLNLTIDSDPERQTSRLFFLQNSTSSRYYQLEVELTRGVASSESAKVYIRDLGNQAFTFNFSYSVINPTPLNFSSSVIISNPRAVPIYLVCCVVCVYLTILDVSQRKFKFPIYRAEVLRSCNNLCCTGSLYIYVAIGVRAPISFAPMLLILSINSMVPT